MPRRGGVAAGIVAGEEQCSTGTCPVVAASPPGSLLARSNARRGHAPSWRRRRRDRCWRGAMLDGDLPRRGGGPGGIVAGEEQCSTGTCPVVAASPPGSLLARSNARRGLADLPRRGGGPGGIVAGEEQCSTGTCPVVAASPPGSLLARSNARRGHAPSWRRRRRDRCWRGAMLDGDMPRRGGVCGGDRYWRGATLGGDIPRRDLPAAAPRLYAPAKPEPADA